MYYYHNDHLGTPMLMTDSSGSVVWSGEFLPFGERMREWGQACRYAFKNVIMYPQWRDHHV